MKNKNFFPIILLIVIIVIALLSIFTTSIEKTSNSTEISDYTPEEEISNNSLRETIVTLYFLDNSTNNLKSEGKLIDSSLLVENPYKAIVQFLIDGPSSDTLKSIIPENTKILSATLDKNCVVFNFSEELLNYEDDTQKYNIINSILNSVAQLTEVNSIKIQINGETNDSLNEEYSIIK